MALFGYFLSLLAESYPSETTKKRRIMTAESYLHKYSPPLRSQCSHWLWQSVPHGRASGFFNCPRSGSVSRNTPIPCFGGIQDAALAHKRRSLETLGFKWHSLGTFCCYWQKVTRRRHKKEKDHGPLKATFTNIARHCEASAHTACGNPSPTVERQTSSTAHVAAACVEIRHFPASAGFRMQLLPTKEEVLNP